MFDLNIGDHKLILNKQDFDNAIKNCIEAKIFSFDIETAPKYKYRNTEAYPEAVFNPQQSNICTISFSHDKTFAYVIPLRHNKGANIDFEKYMWDTLQQKIFNNKDVLKVVFNAAFEFKFLTEKSVFCDNNIMDVHLLAVRVSQVLRPKEVNPAMPNSGYGLKDLSKKWLNHDQMRFETLLKHNDAKFFDDLDIIDGFEYAAEDSNLPLALLEIFKEQAESIEIPKLCNGVDLGERPYKNYYEWILGVESPATRAIGMMQCWGLTMNTTRAELLKKRMEAEQEQSRDDLINLAIKCGVKDIKPGKTGKSKSVKDFLFKTLECPILELTDAGGISMSSESIRDTIMLLETDLKDPNSLKQLEEINDSVDIIQNKINSYKKLYAENNNDPIYNKYIEKAELDLQKIEQKYFAPHKYKGLVLDALNYINNIQSTGTLLSSHINGRLKHVNDEDGRVKPSYNAWTDTSRFASQKPNGQNMPRSDKDKFGVRSLHQPAKGHIFACIDYQAQEVRVAADMYQEQHLIDMILKGVDIHSATAKGCFNLDIDVFKGDKAPKQERTAAKVALFGSFYGGSAYSLINLYRNSGMYKSLKYCKNVINGLMTTYPGMPNFQDSIVEYASEHGYVETFLGYRRLLTSLLDDDELEAQVEARWFKSHAQFMNRLVAGIDKIIQKRLETVEKEFDGAINGAADIPTAHLHLIKDFFANKKSAKYKNAEGFLEFYSNVEQGSTFEKILVYTINYIKKSERRQLRGRAARQALNTPIQGSAADITKVGLNKIMDLFASGELHQDDIKLVATVHDENVFEIDAERLGPKRTCEIIDVLVGCMSGKVLPGLKIEQIAEPEIVDPHNVFKLQDETVCNGWSHKIPIESWLKSLKEENKI